MKIVSRSKMDRRPKVENHCYIVCIRKFDSTKLIDSLHMPCYQHMTRVILGSIMIPTFVGTLSDKCFCRSLFWYKSLSYPRNNQRSSFAQPSQRRICNTVYNFLRFYFYFLFVFSCNNIFQLRMMIVSIG